MSLRKYQPITPGQRQLVLVSDKLWSGKPFKGLTKGLSKTGGRNNHGHITTRHIGGGHKKSYRTIDFRRNKFDVEAIVERIEYDPNRTAFIALVKYSDNVYSYIIAPQKLKIGDKILSSVKTEVSIGNAMKVVNIPTGTIIHNIELKIGRGGQLARSAGSYAQIVGKDNGYVQIKLRSGEYRLVPEGAMATIGSVSNPDNQNQKFGKAGRMVWKGKRPTVRGVAMNPVDHPHGGGEGKTSGGRHPVTPWGKKTKGLRTRSNKSTNKFIIRRRHKK
ncbi:MAG: 50S ribosomal protein L2 [Alphaproteobacteria bacterium]|jgi:large subunit ribosomal protein L2|nr:50S ribosomal protein L2 [Alphaproteobacteria bacterium]